MEERPPPEDGPPLRIPGSLEDELQTIDFVSSDSVAPGIVTFKGTYTNTQQQHFVLTLAARHEDEALARFRSETKMAFLAQADDGAPDERAEKTNDECKPLLPQLIEENVREAEESEPEESEAEEQVIGLDVVCDSLPDFSQQAERRGVEMFGLIDPSIQRNHRHCYCGPNRVICSVSEGRVTLGGLTNDPKQVPVPPTQNRDANWACWVRGEAAYSVYKLSFGWSRVSC